jgi:hypothetical protein
MYQGDPSVLVVGEPFDGELVEPTQERCELVVRDGGAYSLLLYFPEYAPEADEGLAARARFAVLTARDVLTVAFRFGEDFQWSTTSYHHGVFEHPATLGETPATALKVVAVDAATGVVRHIRTGHWSTAFAAVVHDELVREAAESVEADERDRRAAALHAAYPGTKKLLAIARATCTLAD